MKFWCIFNIFLMHLSSSQGASTPKCPPKWIKLPDSFTCYLKVPSTVNWFNAKSLCSSKNRNSQLVIIDNAVELDFIIKMVPEGELWVGDEISTYPLPRLCLKSVLSGSSQVLLAERCDTKLAYVCELDISPNPCTIEPPTVPTALTFFPHPALPYKFIQCTLDGRAYVRLCAKGSVWNQDFLTCIAIEPRPPMRRRRRGDKVDIGPGPDYIYDNEIDEYDLTPIKTVKKSYRKHDKLGPYRLSPVVGHYRHGHSKPPPLDYYKSPFYRTIYDIETPYFKPGYPSYNDEEVDDNDDYQDYDSERESVPFEKGVKRTQVYQEPLPTTYVVSKTTFPTDGTPPSTTDPDQIN